MQLRLPKNKNKNKTRPRLLQSPERIQYLDSVMSLLEDVFLEDEAGEAQDLERIIEGDGYDDQERNSDDDDNGEPRDDEAEEDKRRVDPNSTKTKKVVKNPRFVLNPARLTGPRGIHVIPEHFKNFKFKGKGHEKDDLDMVMKKLEHWAYRLYPKFKFEDCLKKMEMLGKKRTVMVHLHKIRSDQYTTDETIVQQDSSDAEDVTEDPPPAPQEDDEFDKLLQQQIELANTPAGKRVMGARDIGTPMSMPKATSSPSISEEQKLRMLHNRAMAEQRRLDKLKRVQEASGFGAQAEQESVDLTATEQNATKKQNEDRSQINKASDNENENVGMTVDDHSNNISEEISIDLTNEGKIRDRSVNLNVNSKDTESVVDLTEITDVAVSRKRRSNIYNDSDSDDDSKSDGESVFINDTDISVGKTTDINKKVGNNTVFNEDLTVDLTEIGVKPNKRIRKAVIDSSDEECDVTAEDISITVDVHRENSQPIKNRVDNQENNLPVDNQNGESAKEKYGVLKSNNDFDNQINVASQKEETYRIEEQNNIDNIATIDKRKNNNKTKEDQFDKQKTIDEIETSDYQINEDINEIGIEVRSDSNTSSNKIVSEKQGNTISSKEMIFLDSTSSKQQETGNSVEYNAKSDPDLANKTKEESVQSNINGKDIVDDVMDVDFSEEF